MANISERRDKSGKLVSFQIRVHRGRDSTGKQLKPFTDTFKVEPSWSEKTARKKAEAYAAVFEKQCKDGHISDNRQTFEKYCEYVISLKEQTGTKHSTICLYKALTKRIYPAIGHLKVKDIRTDTLNVFYSELQKNGQNKATGGKLSAKTVIEHHRLISTVLQQAVKEQIIMYNPARNTTLPKREKKKVNYFQPETVAAIRNALEKEPLKWKTLVHMLLITGARRGEILGLKWDCVDFKNNRVHICNNVLYTPDRGIYEDTPKTSRSDRIIALPPETMRLLAEYKMWQTKEINRLQGFFIDRNFLFAQDNGSPIHPSSVKVYLDRFSEKNGLPHLNAHAFRHTMASILYFNGVDSVSISKRLGHSQPSTTTDIYAHIIEKADETSADILSKAFLKNA